MAKKERTALEAAMDILTLRAHGREELSRKLAQRGFPEEEIEGALDRALELGLMEPAMAAAIPARIVRSSFVSKTGLMPPFQI